jgi:probable rRNA maturation factor
MDTEAPKILLFVESRYKVNRKRIVATASEFLKKQGIHGPAEVSLAVVGDRKMRQLNNKYRGLDKTTNVLTFPLAEGPSSQMPKDVVRLGDLVVAYPQVIREAAAEDILVDDKIDELIVHGLHHLLGIHHE